MVRMIKAEYVGLDSVVLVNHLAEFKVIHFLSKMGEQT